MPKILFSIGLFVSLCSCKNIAKKRTITQIAIKEFKIKNSSIRAIKAIDKQTLYYAGSAGDIGKTTDGGTTWQKVQITYKDSISPHFRSIAYHHKNIFALSIESPALLYKITENNTSQLIYQENHPNAFYDALCFSGDGKFAIAVGDPTENCPSMIISEDSGQTWHKIPCKNLPKLVKGEAFFAASNTNIKILGSTIWMASGGAKARVFKSINKGRSWQVYDTPIMQGNGPQGIYSIDFYSQNKGIAIGGNYTQPDDNSTNIAITKDGGKTWEMVAKNKEPNYKSCIKYVPDTNGKELFAVGKTGISFSNDGGYTWKKVSSESYYAIDFVDKNTAWLSGHHKIGKLSL